MPIVALIWGILAFTGFTIGLIPCFGWLNWFNIPFSILGVVFGILGAWQAHANRQPPAPAIVGLVLSIVAVAFGFVRLLLGGGLL